jgi:hypothetical protein
VEQAAMMEESDTIQVGRKPSRATLFAVGYAEESARRSVPYANEVLKHLGTLNATLLGGSIVFLKEDVVQPGYRLAASAAFLLSLAMSLWGSLPAGDHVVMICPDDIMDHRERVLTVKLRCVRWACLSMFAGFVVVLAGLAVR